VLIITLDGLGNVVAPGYDKSTVCINKFIPGEITGKTDITASNPVL